MMRLPFHLTTLPVLASTVLACLLPPAGALAATHQEGAATGQAPLPDSPQAIPLPELRLHRPTRPKPQTLECGARLLVIEDHSLPLVDGSILFPGGSVHEEARQVGLASVMAETLRQGGSKTLAGADLDTWLDRHAVELSISSDAEFLTVEFSCLAEDLSETMALIGDLLARPAYPAEDLERVRRQALTSLERRADDAGTLAGEVIEMLAYGPDSPWARQPTPETLAAIDRAALVRFHRLHIAANRAIVGVAGDVDPAELARLVEAALAPLPRAEGKLASPPRPFIQPRRTRVHILDRPGVPQTELRIAAPGVRRLDPDYCALRLWSTVVGSGGMTSRLMMRVRTELGLAYTVGGFFGFGWGQAGRLYAWCGTSNEGVGEALAAMIAVLEASKAPFPAEELEAFRTRATNAGVFFADTPAKLLRRAVSLLAHDHPADFDDRWPEALRELTAEDLSDAANRHLDTSSLVILAVGPAEPIRAALSAGEPPHFVLASQIPVASGAIGTGGTIELVFVDDHGRPLGDASPPAPQPPLVDSLLDALGGREAWAAARLIEAELTMTLPDGREIPSRQWKDLATPRLRQTITFEDVERTTVLSDGEAWTRVANTLTQLEPTTTAQMVRAHDRGLWNLLHRLATRKDVSATANPDGSLQLSTPAGFAGRLDLDDAFRPTRLTFTETDRRQIFDYTDYRTSAGLTYPAHARQSPLGTSIFVHKLTPHADVPEGIFERP
jgi:zinc protease